MLAPLFAALISTLSLEGDITESGGDYVRVEFEVPEGTVEIRMSHTDNSDSDVLDFGLTDPSGFRGWCGGLEADAVIGAEESSRCYLPGAISAGTWHVDIGKAKLVSDTVHYNIELEFHDVSSLTPRPRAEFDQPVLETTARWYRGDLHVHSTESGDATATFEEIHQLAVDRGLDFINLSDHNTITQHDLVAAFQQGVDDLLFLRGSEVTTYAGHGNTIGNAGYIEHKIGLAGHGIADLLGQVADQGALFIINHPELDLGDACIGCAWRHDDAPLELVAAMELHTGAYDYVPVFGRNVLARWDAMLDDGHRITGVAGSDDHRATTEPGPTDSQIGSPTTLVYADELSEAAIMDGIRQGRVIVNMRGPDDPGLDFTALTDRGDSGMIGDTVTAGAVTLRATVTGGAGLSLQLWRNGRVDESVTIDSDEFSVEFARDTAEAGDRYRVQLADAFDVVISNHIWVEYAEPVDKGGCGCRASSSGQPLSAALVALAVFGFTRRRSRR